MKKRPIATAHSPAWRWLPILAALSLTLVLGSASVAHAASPAIPADCSTPTGTPGPVTIKDWIGGDMTAVSFTGGGCSATGQITVDNKGVATLSFPAGTSLQPGVEYSVNGSATINPSVQVFGQCVVLSITCTIVGGTFMIDANGVEHFNGSISCVVVVPFLGSGSYTDVFNGGGNGGGGNGSGPPAATPELSSSALVATGLAPTLIILYRRRRCGRRATEE